MCHFIPADCQSRLRTEPYGGLFRALRLAGEACRKALPDIGQRTYPIAHTLANTASLTCLLLIEAIRRNPHFADREATYAIQSIEAASAALDRIKSPSVLVRAAQSRLRDVVYDLERMSAETLKANHAAH